MSSIYEQVKVNGLELNTAPGGGNYSLESFDPGTPAKKPEWAQGADADGADLVRTPLFENRTVTIKLRVERQASMNLALEQLGALVDQLQEAEKDPGGIPVVWTPANSTKSITFYALTGSVTGLPIAMDGSDAGWFVNAPLVTFTLTCKPFGYGAQVSAGAAVSNVSQPNLTLTVAGVPGDVPAEGQLIITDTAGGAGLGRRHVEWGLESRYYNSETSLLLDSEDMIPVAGVQSNEVGGYQRAGASYHNISTDLVKAPTICCSTGNLSHVGTFRVKARVCALLNTGSDISNISLRLNWQDGEGPFRPNAWCTPNVAEGFCEVDLGVITIAPAQLGTQKWGGRIEAFSLSQREAGTDTLLLDYLTFIPILEGYGKARGVQVEQPGTVAAFDDFTTGTLSGSLNGRAAPVGGTWATSGATTDFTVSAPIGGIGRIKRETISDSQSRYAILGPVMTNSRVKVVPLLPGALGWVAAAVARYVDNSNYCYFLFEPTIYHGATGRISGNVRVGLIIAGSNTSLVAAPVEAAAAEFCTLELKVLEDGNVTASASQRGTVLKNLSISHAALATGGALASGKCGLLDRNSIGSLIIREYQMMAAMNQPPVPYCIQPHQSMRITSDSAIAEDSTGTYYGLVPEYRGSRFYVPQAGAANRATRIVVKVDKNDLETSNQPSYFEGAFTAQVVYTPRYHVIPR